MVLCLKVRKERGEQVRKFLVKKGLLDLSRIIGRTSRELIFPLTKAADKKAVEKFGVLVERNLERAREKKVLRLSEALKGVIPKEAAEQMGRSYDVVGDIAVLEIPDGLERLEKSIAWTVKRMLPNVQVVVKKGRKRSRKYRIRQHIVLTGENRTETIAKESGALLRVDLNKAYYSSRFGSERLRILRQIKPGERILVMFAGVGPYPLVFAKHKDVLVWAIEINPAAYKFMVENVRMNKLKDRVFPIKGDVRKVVPELAKAGLKFDRICMPLPEQAHEFLDLAFSVAQKGAIVHIYQFVREGEFKKRGKELVALCKKLGRKVKLKKITRSGHYAPRTYSVCYDLEVEG